MDLRDAGFDLVALDQSGFKVDELQSANYTDAEISKTAAFVGMERSALHRKLKLLGISVRKNGLELEEDSDA